MRLTRSHALLGVGTIFAILLFIVIYINRIRIEISPEEARSNVRKGFYDYVVDVRTESEWDQGHLENSMSIPIGNFVSELPTKIPNKNARILFVCRKGIRASAVAAMAQKLGYTNVHAMMGNYSELMV